MHFLFAYLYKKVYNAERMQAGVYYNKKYLSDNAAYVEQIQRTLSAANIESKIIDTYSDLDGMDVLFVLGGDGTILTVASECAKRGIKIIGVNYGHMGFLAEFEPEKLDEAISLVCGGNYKIQRRSMLDIECSGKKYLALNDLVIQRNTGGANFSNTVSLHAEIDGSTVDNFSSDGIIISTPTGSTAYSLAAGGSVLTPDINAFILTPICAHSLHSRPVVFGDGSTLKISPVGAREPLAFIVDGRVVGEILNGDTVTVRKSDKCVEFITRDDKDFFNKLLIKLNIWSK